MILKSHAAHVLIGRMISLSFLSVEYEVIACTR